LGALGTAVGAASGVHPALFVSGGSGHDQIFWLVGQYDDAHRARVRTDRAGAYTLEGNYPAFYGAGGPHIPLYIAANRYSGVETDLSPACNQTQGVLAAVLRPGWLDTK
jgi:hypothetical protein